MGDVRREHVDNVRFWDAVLPHHVRSPHYDLLGFVGGADPLDALVVDEVGPVAGKRLLHLQCHFGLDTLGWARRGAHVTGLDFSAKAVMTAQNLADKVGMPATFVQADVLDAAAALHGETFDVVTTSWGVLMWLSDLQRWAEQVAAVLAPGGVFHLAEVHPMVWMFLDPDDPDAVSSQVVSGYFRERTPRVTDEHGSYAAPDAYLDHTITRQWRYELGAVVTALVEAGLTLSFVREHDRVPLEVLPVLERGDDGWYRMPDGVPGMPLAFSVRAKKPG